MKLFQNVEKGRFIRRPNRFIIECTIKGRKIKAHLPNPGRMQELLLPDSRIYLVHNGSPERKTDYTAVAVDRDGSPVFLHTHLTNHVARHLIEEEKITELKGYRVIKPEVSMGRSRFDFFLQNGKRQMILEVKSCTLFGEEMAMFPDAVTERGRRHIIELAELNKNDLKTAVLFIVHKPDLKYFLPEYHTDLAFSQTLYHLRNKLLILAVAVDWKKDLSLGKRVKDLVIPWNLLKQEAHDSGSYMVILKLARNRKITIGKLGQVSFPKGFYIYTGSAKRNLSKRIERHRRTRKKLFWHIDYLREHAVFYRALPVRSSTSLECDLANRIGRISNWTVKGFGASDCSCRSHLFGFESDPMQSPSFHQLVQYFRIDRLLSELKEEKQDKY